LISSSINLLHFIVSNAQGKELLKLHNDGLPNKKDFLDVALLTAISKQFCSSSPPSPSSSVATFSFTITSLLDLDSAYTMSPTHTFSSWKTFFVILKICVSIFPPMSPTFSSSLAVYTSLGSYLSARISSYIQNGIDNLLSSSSLTSQAIKLPQG